MTPAVFLDRDGTINVEKNYIYKIEDFEYTEGAVKALKCLKDARYLLIVISNQSGIARGYYSEDDYNNLNEWMLADLERKGIHIDGSYYCPHHPEGKIQKYRVSCDCRKPRTGLFWQAIKEHQIDVDKSYAIGDRIRDMSICKECDVQGILITNESLHNFGAERSDLKVSNIGYSDGELLDDGMVRSEPANKEISDKAFTDSSYRKELWKCDNLFDAAQIIVSQSNKSR